MKNFKDDHTLLGVEEACDWQASLAVLEIASDEDCLERLRQMELLRALMTQQDTDGDLRAAIGVNDATPDAPVVREEAPTVPESFAASVGASAKGMIVDAVLGSGVTLVFLLSVGGVGLENLLVMGAVSAAIGGGFSWLAARSVVWT